MQQREDSNSSSTATLQNSISANPLPTLIVKSASKAYPAHILKSLAAETIDTYPNTMTHVYADWSALNAVEQAGYGLTIKYQDATRKYINEACGQHCNKYDA